MRKIVEMGMLRGRMADDKMNGFNTNSSSKWTWKSQINGYMRRKCDRDNSVRGRVKVICEKVLIQKNHHHDNQNRYTEPTIDDKQKQAKFEQITHFLVLIISWWFSVTCVSESYFWSFYFIGIFGTFQQ